MNTIQGMAILKSLAELESVSELATPNGRWHALQDWLRRNPKWKKEVEAWVKLTPDEAFNSLRNFVASLAEMPPNILDLLIDAGMKFRVKKSIQTLQACYRERKETEA